MKRRDPDGTRAGGAMKIGWYLWAIGLLLAPAAARAGDAYFVTVFGAQRPLIKLPRRTHSFAAFFRVCPGQRVEAFTISWLPASGEMRPLALAPEPGRNFTLNETLAFCAANRMEVAAWGPYQIDPCLWDAALRQKARLESGQVLYKALDFGSPDGTVSNCVHALEHAVRPPGQWVPEIVVAPANWGESGSYWVALLLRPWYVAPCQTHPWVLPLIGLDPGAFAYYDLARNPTRFPGIRLTQAAFQSNLLPNRVRCGP
jgi:hypothetical protein